MPKSPLPKRSTRVVAGVVCAAALSLRVGGAAAQYVARAEPAWDGLEYTAPAGCPARDAWLGRVRERLGTGPSQRTLEQGVRASVVIAPSGEEASIVFQEGGGERRISGADCEEVASAAALIVAVALGSSSVGASTGPSSAGPSSAGSANAGSATLPATPTPPAPAAPAPAEPSPAAPSPAASSPTVPAQGAAERAALAPRANGARSGSTSRAASRRQARAASAADPRVDASAASDAETPSRRWGIDLGASAEVNNWLAPWPARAFGGSVELVSPSRGWSARAVGVYGFAERAVAARRADFSYWGGHLDVCPIAIGGARSWRWTSCAELHVGLLRAEGDESSSLATALSQQALLLTTVAGTRLQTPPLWALRLEVEAGLAIPVLRQTFQFESPDATLFQSPAVGLVARAGLVIPLDGPGD